MKFLMLSQKISLMDHQIPPHSAFSAFSHTSPLSAHHLCHKLSLFISVDIIILSVISGQSYTFFKTFQSCIRIITHQHLPHKLSWTHLLPLHSQVPNILRCRERTLKRILGTYPKPFSCLQRDVVNKSLHLCGCTAGENLAFVKV